MNLCVCESRVCESWECVCVCECVGMEWGEDGTTPQAGMEGCKLRGHTYDTGHGHGAQEFQRFSWPWGTQAVSCHRALSLRC